MKVLIIEDEINGARYLQHQLEQLEPGVDVVHIFESVHDTVNYLKHHNGIDLLLTDIKLSDGYCFDIFNQLPVTIPSIFITAYDEFVLDALRHNGIEYLLKPVDHTKLAAALRKYHDLEQHFVYHNLRQLARQLQGGAAQRIIIKRGSEFQVLLVSEVAYLFVEHKIVFCVDRNGRKFMTEWNNLQEAVQTLEPDTFFKANRKYLINPDFIRSFRPAGLGRTAVEMAVGASEPITISQENSAQFRTWLRGSTA